ncbi:MAG TPA: hypothetical protein VLB02_00220, partial [Candidatus Paceibacterota bacterium]|nr:hypothetical protein [Candidatus Paceibacterota bacterium]
IPENPRPFEQVTATLRSYTIDIDQVVVTWTYSGAVVTSGRGIKSVTVEAGPLGSKRILEATIRTNEGSVVHISTTLVPASTDLLWESIDAYTPPFYKGKPLPASEGLIRVSAFPERAALARTFSYSWSKDGTVIDTSSGYGKIGFIYKNSYLNSSDAIDVGIRRTDGTVQSGRIQVPTAQPFFVFYRKAGGFTDYATAIGASYRMQDQTETFVAEPFSFSALKPITQVLTLQWSLGGEAVENGDRVNEIVLDRGNGSGSAPLGIAGKHQSFITQFAEASFQLNF